MSCQQCPAKITAKSCTKQENILKKESGPNTSQPLKPLVRAVAMTDDKKPDKRLVEQQEKELNSGTH